MRIPDRVRITRKVSYRIEYVLSFEDPELVGMCDEGAKIIYLKVGEPDIFSTFWHEVLHAAAFEYNIKLTHKQIYALEKPLSVITTLNRLGRR